MVMNQNQSVYSIIKYGLRSVLTYDYEWINLALTKIKSEE